MLNRSSTSRLLSIVDPTLRAPIRGDNHHVFLQDNPSANAYSALTYTLTIQKINLYQCIFRQVKVWFQNRRMKHKRQQQQNKHDDQKNEDDTEHSDEEENSESEDDNKSKCASTSSDNDGQSATSSVSSSGLQLAHKKPGGRKPKIAMTEENETFPSTENDGDSTQCSDKENASDPGKHNDCKLDKFEDSQTLDALSELSHVQNPKQWRKNEEETSTLLNELAEAQSVRNSTPSRRLSPDIAGDAATSPNKMAAHPKTERTRLENFHDTAATCSPGASPTYEAGLQRLAIAGTSPVENTHLPQPKDHGSDSISAMSDSGDASNRYPFVNSYQGSSKSQGDTTPAFQHHRTSSVGFERHDVARSISQHPKPQPAVDRSISVPSSSPFESHRNGMQSPNAFQPHELQVTPQMRYRMPDPSYNRPEEPMYNQQPAVADTRFGRSHQLQDFFPTGQNLANHASFRGAAPNHTMSSIDNSKTAITPNAPNSQGNYKSPSSVYFPPAQAGFENRLNYNNNTYFQQSHDQSYFNGRDRWPASKQETTREFESRFSSPFSHSNDHYHHFSNNHIKAGHDIVMGGSIDSFRDAESLNQAYKLQTKAFAKVGIAQTAGLLNSTQKVLDM